MTLIVLAIAWLLGILAADLLQLPMLPLAIAAAVCAPVALLAGRAPRVRLAALVLGCAALGGVRLDMAQATATPRSVWLLNEHGDIVIEGLVIEDPKRTEEGQRVLVAVDRALVDGRTRLVEGLVLAKLPPYPERRYGDRLRLSGPLTTPREAERPGQFDYRVYLARKRIFSLLEPKTVRLLSERNGQPAWAALLELRDRARRVLLRELPEPQASLAVGILLGLQSSIPADVTANFSATGTSHILVISGWNRPGSSSWRSLSTTRASRWPSCAARRSNPARVAPGSWSASRMAPTWCCAILAWSRLG
jgi:competence protein ComEC